VATNVGGIKEVMNEKVGSMVKPAEPLELARALDEILQNEELRQKKALAAQEHSHKYSTLKVPY